MKHNIVAEGLNYRLVPVTLEHLELIISIRSSIKANNLFINKISENLEDQITWLNEYNIRPNDYYFAIENKFTSEIEGFISIYNLTKDNGEWGRWVIKSGSLSSVESFSLIHEIGFNILHLEEIFSITVANNLKVIKFHEQMGAEKSEYIENYYLKDSEYLPGIKFTLSRELFFAKSAPIVKIKSERLFIRNTQIYLNEFEFHHIGVATENIDNELSMYILLGYSEESSFTDYDQGVKGVFMIGDSKPRVEILEDLENSDTLEPFLRRGSKLYHLAFIVNNLEESINKINVVLGGKLLHIKKSIYFNSNVAFVVLKNKLIIELIEKFTEGAENN